ncbi:methyltransferase domain-containing protein [Sphingomonadaceae bacterium G21617-S1]|jgi:NADH dehydrogenase [ubiquinone] 1 alpha subcomplex assembly factor 5|uniref:class I SAM-dependent methyltransferase n=1 Tax=Rhizorhabdus sp. TaxID=1968843 RepID=UPI0019B5D713|nr:class I SAM-dependent methyltransferase [Rhizorhabdus sp.]MBD3760334.1 methyltransferase domain-containing protein [Rhizorhabdus sp.]MCZ4340778.1 methyltransferase domain-containing protein [Sphingomonadaceae bacterium G21617-S1]
MDAPEIFDRSLRRRRRDRAAPRFAEHDFLIAHMADELADRLAMVTRTFDRALILGSHGATMAPRFAAPGRMIVQADPGFAFAQASKGVQCDEDRLPFADASFDLVVAIGTLDSVNDLPGALALIRRILRPDGLFLGAFTGAGSLDWLKRALLAADVATSGGAAARVHPQIDVRSAGDLLARVGFALPVADGDRLDIGYGDPIRLLHDLRGMAATNLLVQRSRNAPGRAWLGALFEQFASAADADGRLRERFDLVYLSGWSPSPDQPRPAKRGSATASLAEALKPRP